MTEIFSLRKLEMALPFLQAIEKEEPKALVHLAAIALADEASLKLVDKGNAEIMDALCDQAYGLDLDEVAALLADFTVACQRFKLRVGGLRPEEVNQVLAGKMKEIRAGAGLPSLDA